jgi:hypothetical protein
MALLTHKVSSCTDNYSLFAKEKHFYGIPYIDRSRSSIPSDASSFFSSAALSLRESNQDLSLIPPRNIRSSSARFTAPTPDAQIPRTLEDAEATALHIVEITAQQDASDVSFPDFEEYAEEDARSDSAEPSSPLDNASFVTAKSANIPTITVKEDGDQEKNPYVFHRWMKTMFRKSPSPKYLSPDTANDGADCLSLRSTGHSSSGFVSAVKTASITLASFPMSGHSTSRKSSFTILDQDTISRMLDRKHALEELITTEEYYIRDLKSLKDVSINLRFDLRSNLILSLEIPSHTSGLCLDLLGR